MYGGLPGSRYARPAHRLLGFARVDLAAGESRALAIPVSLRTLAVRQGGTWVIEPGRYEICVARHADDPDAVRLWVDNHARHGSPLPSQGRGPGG